MTKLVDSMTQGPLAIKEDDIRHLRDYKTLRNHIENRLKKANYVGRI